jgi:Tfp pilus assembly protein PilF
MAAHLGHENIDGLIPFEARTTHLRPTPIQSHNIGRTHRQDHFKGRGKTMTGTFWLRFARAVIAGTGMIVSSLAMAAPYTPKSDDTVLERVRTNLNDTQTAKLREMRRALEADPQNGRLAATLARTYIERSRLEADPRYIGRAQAVLNPWWMMENPPQALLVLRATLKQSLHQFEDAMVDLEKAVKQDRFDPQAWVTLATVQAVTGDLDSAKRSCVPLFQSSTELVAVTCVTNVAGVNGQATKAFDTLKVALERNQAQATIGEKLWAYTTLAETAARANRADAETYYKQALALNEPDVYLMASYADFLLEQGRAREVIALIGNNIRPDALLLRLILAQKALNAPNLNAHVETMKARIAANRARGDTVHRREESIFTLHALGDAGTALELASTNFGVQKEPIDVRVLLEAAMAAKQPRAATPALEFVKQSKLEDAAIQKLVKQLEGMMR